MFSKTTSATIRVKTKKYEWEGLPQEGKQQSNTSAEQPSNKTILEMTKELKQRENILIIHLSYKQILR